MSDQWRREGGGAKGGIRPGGTVQGAAFGGAKYGILKFVLFWRIGVCIFLAVATDQPKFHCIT